MYLSATRRTRIAALCTAALTVAGTWLGVAQPATAATALVTCPLGTETITYTPGLKLPAVPPAPPNPTVSLSASGTLATCVSLDLQHTSGTITFTGAGPLTCLGGNSSGSGRVTWSNPGTTPSDFTFTGGVSVRPNGVTVLVLSGNVTAGDFTGAAVVNTIVLASTDLTACLTPAGLTTSSGPITLTLASP
ncbi:MULTISPECIES: hypothetical protein [unclassified Streptomyces]|uniref:hypothetical protein n=1 Tax=unclassified Streptomyces TaxID=2593676 RepID=UPI000BEF8824|nr:MULTISPECIES: hypothetical protein [unclassified Streptomyces]